jgi:hypothetical protein
LPISPSDIDLPQNPSILIDLPVILDLIPPTRDV